MSVYHVLEVNVYLLQKLNPDANGQMALIDIIPESMRVQTKSIRVLHSPGGSLKR